MVSPKRHFLSLLLIFSLSALFFSHYHSSSSISNPILPLPSQKIPTPNPKSLDFTFIIKVLTFNRFDAVSRCLRSLANADYLSDRVHLHVYIDHFVQADGHLKLNESHRILDFVDGFSWDFGEKIVHYRTGNVGLQAQWLEAWWPSSDNEFAFVVEDDLEVSPLYYKFLKGLISTYYYNSSNYSPSIYGASLQRPRFVPGKHGNKIQLDNGTRLFLYQLVGTWGQLLFPKPWKEFRLWYDKHKAMGIKPFLEGMVTNGWYKKMGERIWTPWFIKFIHTRGYFNIYTNFLRERALSISHRDAGVNYGKTVGPDSQLLDEKSLDVNLLEMQPLSNLKWYDFCFREVLPERVINSFNELGSVLHSVQKEDTVILVSLFGVLESVTRNLLCHIERLNILNYIFLGPESEFLFDLARRGHPVIAADQFLKSVKAFKWMSLEDSKAKSFKEVLSKAYFIQKCLEFGYNTWVIDGNVLFVNNDPLPKSNPPNDFFIWQSLELFFVRSSSYAKKNWVNNLVSKFEALFESLSRGSALEESIKFIPTAVKLFEQNGVRFKRVDEMSFAVKIGENIATNTSLGDGKKMVFWSAEMRVDVIQKQLEELSLWSIDGEFSCKAVICNRS